MDREEIVTALRGVPARIEEACRGLTDEQWRRRPAEGEWSLLEIVCHIRDSATEEGLRARRMVEGENPALEPWDQEARAVERDYQGEEPAKVLTALRAYVTGYAYQLEGLSDEEWERPGVHEVFGPVTVRMRAEYEVEHSEEHLDEMRAVRERVSGP